MSEQVGENYARQSHDENAQSSKVSQQPNTPFPEADSEGPLEDFSYLDYVSVIPDFAWFAQWLGHEPGPASVWEEILGYPTRVAIVDRINDQMNFHLDIDADNLSEALEGRKPTVSTRIIVLTYEHPWNFDRKFVESIGKWFRINPRFFYGNFVHGDRIHTITPPTFKRQFTTPWVDTLPSQNISFELRQSRHHERNCNTFSAMVLNPSNSNCPEDKKTVLVLIRDGLEPFPPRPNRRLTQNRWPDVQMPLPSELRELYPTVSLQDDTLSSRYLSRVRTMDLKSARSADANPIEYAIPFGHILAEEFGKELDSWFTRYANERYYGRSTYIMADSVDSMILSLQSWLDEIAFAKQNVLRLKSTAAVDGLADDIKYLEERGKSLLNDLRDTLDQHVGLLSIKASEKAISESHRVNRLTYAAFIFIPLSLITSVFGMNVSALGSGPAPIWLPFVISALTLVISVTYMWWASKTSASRAEWKYHALSTLWRVIELSFCFFLRSPVEIYTRVGLWVLGLVRHAGMSCQWPQNRLDSLEESMGGLIHMRVSVKSKVDSWFRSIQLLVPFLRPKPTRRRSVQTTSDDEGPSLVQRWRHNIDMQS